MTIYQNRNSPEFYKVLAECLDLENLKKSSISIDSFRGDKYEKLIRIDFCGIAGTMLFTRTDNEHQHKVQESFLQMLKNQDQLDKEGYLVKTRFIFTYPYSEFSIAQAEAEVSPYRMTMEEKTSHGSVLNLFSLTRDEFKGSDLVVKQGVCLNELERLYNLYCVDAKNFDLLNIKFTTLPIHFRMLAINENYFMEPISYAKRNRHSKILATSPIVYINEFDSESISELEDHFRYIWTHPTTLVYEDATRFKRDGLQQIEDLRKIKEPHDISFEHKIKKFKLLYSGLTDNDKVNRWEFRVESMFRYATRNIDASPDSETLFIAFSFANGKNTAYQFQEFIAEDFPTDSLKVNIVDLNSAKKTLHAELIEKMEEATLGVIIFTKDIVERNENTVSHFSRPNMYFEYGYLLSHIKKIGNVFQRITLFFEEGTKAATDIQDVGRFEYSKNDLLNYLVLLERIFAVNRTLSHDTAEKIKDKFLDKLQAAYNNDSLKDILKQSGRGFIDYRMDVINRLNSVIQKRFGSKRDS